jgi:multiple sugar transport system ATP-binding protein
MTMGDRVAVIKAGYLQQVDTPQNLYDSPVNVFVAAFIGSPSMNLYDGALQVDDGGVGGSVELGSQRLTLPAEVFEHRPALRGYGGQQIVVGIRPEDYEDASVATGSPQDRRLKGTVRLVEALGAELMVHFSIDARLVDSGDPDAPDISEVEGLANSVARFSPRSRVHVDDVMDVAVAVERLHFFDAKSHEAIRS